MFSAKNKETFITLPSELATCIIDYLDLNNQMSMASTSRFFFDQFKCKIEQLIALGCSRKALKEMCEIAQNSPEIIINYNALYNAVKRMPIEPVKEVGWLYARSQMDSAVRLLCLTGELSCTTKVIDLIQNDTTTLHEQISIQTQQNINYLVALNFTAYTNNVVGLQLLWDQLDENTTNYLTDDDIDAPNIRLIPFVNAIYSDNLATLKWVVEAFKIIPQTVEMEEDLLTLLTRVGNASMMDYIQNDCPTINNSF